MIYLIGISLGEMGVVHSLYIMTQLQTRANLIYRQMQLLLFCLQSSEKPSADQEKNHLFKLPFFMLPFQHYFGPQKLLGGKRSV